MRHNRTNSINTLIDEDINAYRRRISPVESDKSRIYSNLYESLLNIQDSKQIYRKYIESMSLIRQIKQNQERKLHFSCEKSILVPSFNTGLQWTNIKESKLVVLSSKFSELEKWHQSPAQSKVKRTNQIKVLSKVMNFKNYVLN